MKVYVYYNPAQDFIYLSCKKKPMIHMFGIKEDIFFASHYIGEL
jgi:uncharacterized protein YuzE